MSEYKRLTNQKWSKDIDLTQELGYSHIYKRLYELEDKVENGTLIELPRIIHPNKQEWFVQYAYESGIITKKIFMSLEKAEKFLEEIRSGRGIL